MAGRIVGRAAGRTAAWAAVVAVCLSASVRAQIDPKTAMLERAGWEALAAGQAHAAAQSFREAIAGDPKNPRLYLGAGTAAFLERRDDDAKEVLEHALRLDPRLTRARALLGQVLYRRGDLFEAIRTLEAVLAEVPNDRDLLETLERWRRESELSNRMQQTVDVHFTVSFEGPEEADLAQQALASLDRAYWRICDLLGSYPLRPVPVVLYSTQQFRDITRSPAWAAASYDGTIRVPMRGALEKSEELDRVLAHEFTHAVVRGLAPHHVPVWLNEGLAAALERDDLRWAHARLQKTGGLALLGTLPATFGRLSDEDAQLAYATSAVAVRRLLDEAGGFAIANLLRDLGEDIAFEDAFTHRIQRTFADFVASLAQ